MTRRSFLDLWKSLAALVAAGAAMPPLLFWWRGTRGAESGADEEAGDWVDLGSARKISEEGWTAKTFELERRNRWRREAAREMIYVKRDGDEFQVLSSICPHTGCLVRRQDEGFTCPCHRSYFDAAGTALEGPSPRNLDALEWKVEKRRLQVRYQRFRPGVAERRAIAG